MPDFETLIKPDIYLWEQLQQHLTQQDLNDKAFIESLQRLALGSNYATSLLSRYPQFIESLKKCDHFELSPQQLQSHLESITEVDQIKKQLRLFRHQKLLEIIYLDICKAESIEHTLSHISNLADLLIQQTQIKAEQIVAMKHGQPVHQNGEPMQLNVIGMGKLGGTELNFSSDIDLICCYSEEGQLKGFGQQTYNQFFTQVVKLFKQLLHDMTPDGFVYRVDLRLRPWGDSGPIVLSHNSFEHYYQLHGREWEQYAMVKARVITGSDSDKNHLQSIIQPFVYRRYHDYRVFDGLAQMKYKIDHKAKQKKQRINVKLGSGGIREIEFFVQAFQILKGGRNHLLQTPSLYQALSVLSSQEITDQPTLELMHSAYNFLRLLENRIQMMNDQQTHEIPDNQNHLDRISFLTGYANGDALLLELKNYQLNVNQVFASLFTQQESRSSDQSFDLHYDELEEEQHYNAIARLNFRDPQTIHNRLRSFYLSKALIYMSDKAKKRFRSFFPELLKQVAQQDEQEQLLDKMLELLSSIAGRSVYFELLYKNIPLLEKLVHLFNSSNWIASEVTRNPILLESLLYPEHLDSRFDTERLKQTLSIQLTNIVGDEELELDVLRQFKREQTLVIATAEIAGEISTEEVSRYLCDLAGLLLQAIYELSLNWATTQYGLPGCVVDEQHKTPGLGIIAYGKLGGFELHYQSDLDIIFLHTSSGQNQHTNGAREIDNSTFFSRLAQKIISKITLLTAAGKLYEIDTRLRPDGASGMLVSSVTAYHQYQMEKAWIWEHQAILRARFIAGSPDVQQSFNATRLSVLRLKHNPMDLARAITDMREKMYQAKKPPEGELLNIKDSKGCMVDIEFMVQYLVLLHANKFASLCETTDNIGLITELHRLGLVDEEFIQLGPIYQNFHKWLHTRVLQNLSPEIESQHIKKEIDIVKSCWDKTFTGLKP